MKKITVGFHLIEILITLAIISILITLGIPMYSHYVTQERRLEAATILSQLALALEQYHIEQNSYEQATLPLLHFPKTIAKNTYQLAIQSATDTQYFLTATPLGIQAIRDVACATLTLNAKGEKGNTGAKEADECW